MALHPYQERVIAEKKLLDENIARLGDFLNGETLKSLPILDQRLLDHQHAAMRFYSQILGWRIERFKSPTPTERTS